MYSRREGNMENKLSIIREAFIAAFPHTVPILAGFLFLGMAYGIYMNVSGFSFWYPMLMILMTLMINARHLFYGISMLEKYRHTGWKKIYLIFGMCDESFSINYTARIPKDIDRGWFMFAVTVFNHMYWVVGATLGGIFGSLIHFDTEGLEFVMTAMFVVIFLEQWLHEKNHISSILGILISVICLCIFGADNFIIPSMLIILATLTLLRSSLKKGAFSK